MIQCMIEIICDEQNGFLSKRSCTDHLFSLCSIVRNTISQGRCIYAAFIDMEKAFDWTNRNLLFYRLLELNIDGKIFEVIKSIYTDNKASVNIGNVLKTEWFEVPCGVRQGDPLSPTLFNIYLNIFYRND